MNLSDSNTITNKRRAGNFSELLVEVVKAVPAPVPPRDLRALLQSAAGVAEIGARVTAGSSIAVRVTGDRELRRLNRKFLDEDRPTDVLAFPSGETGEGAHLGDIAISWPAVRRQAREHGHTDWAEIALLAVHGLLHVLGWDHATEPQRLEMTRLTAAALERSGVRLGRGRL